MAEAVVTPRAAEAQWLLHCAPGDAAPAGAALGVELGTTMLRCTNGSGWHALHLAPDEWLLIGALGLAPATPPCAHALVDVSERMLGFKLRGADAVTALNAACPLDLAEAAFPVGACSRTLFGKVMVVLWRSGPTDWRIDCGRSFAPYVAELLELAVADADD